MIPKNTTHTAKRWKWLNPFTQLQYYEPWRLPALKDMLKFAIGNIHVANHQHLANWTYCPLKSEGNMLGTGNEASFLKLTLSGISEWNLLPPLCWTSMLSYYIPNLIHISQIDVTTTPLPDQQIRKGLSSKINLLHSTYDFCSCNIKMGWGNIVRDRNPDDLLWVTSRIDCQNKIK